MTTERRICRAARRAILAGGLAIGIMLPSPVSAQTSAPRTAPRIGYVYPAGGQQGTTFTVSVGGQNLTGPMVAHIFGAGVRAKIVNYDRPLTQKEINDLREMVQQLQEKRSKRGTGALTAAEQKALADARTKLAGRPNRPANPAIAETVTLEVTIAADAALGERDLRIQAAAGLSNPLTFCVGQLPEFAAPVVTATMPAPQRARGAKSNLEVKLPALVNGQILPGEVDRIRFTARKGQRLTVVTNARGLIPFLADAVPGWFQATIGLYNAQGREIAYADDYRFNPDPVLGYDVPADGEYSLEIKDAIYRGREDFVYRVAIGELPFITGIFPLGGKLGTDIDFELTGWNLPTRTLKVGTKDGAPGGFSLTVRKGDYVSNPVRFAVDTAPELTAARAPSAQTLSVPLTINSRIERPADEDVYRFNAAPGSAIVAEIFARRLNSPLDSTLEVVDSAGKRIAFNDDHEDKGAGLLTHHADSRVAFDTPADGVFLVKVRDGQQQGGVDYAYRLRVDTPQPDFALRVVPSSINVRAGGSVPVTVYALRRDGFSGEIALGLEDAPRGFALSGARVPAGQDMVQMTLTVATANVRDEPMALKFAGVATINGSKVARRATPAEDLMQAFAYHHLVPSRELKVEVNGRGTTFRVASRAPVQIPSGGQARVRIAMGNSRPSPNARLDLVDPPDGITVASSRASGDTIEAVIACDALKAKPGLAGNLVFSVFGDRSTGTKTKAKTQQRAPLGLAPAVPFEVVGLDGLAAAP